MAAFKTILSYGGILTKLEAISDWTQDCKLCNRAMLYSIIQILGERENGHRTG